MGNKTSASELQLAWRRFRDNRRAVACLWVLGVLYAVTLFADVGPTWNGLL